MGLFKHHLICLLIALAMLCSGQGNMQMGGIEPFGQSNEYLMGTVFFSAVDVTIISFNAVRLTKGDPNPSNAPFGMLMGTAQMAYGLMNLKSTDWRTESLTAANIGIGVVTIVTSLMRTYRKVNGEQKMTLDLFTVPGGARYSGALGVKVIRRF